MFSGLTLVLLVAAVLLAIFVHPHQISVGGVPAWPLWVNLGTALVQLGIVAVKTLFFCWIFVWVRWTLPRFRYDQVMNLGWKILLNVALVNLLVTAVVAKLVKG
jgi:NADH-quinone oxidoreductase subunit H